MVYKLIQTALERKLDVDELINRLNYNSLKRAKRKRSYGYVIAFLSYDWVARRASWSRCMTTHCSSVHRATKLINLHDPLFTDNVVLRRSNDCNHALLSSYNDRTRFLSSQRASAFITKAERLNCCKLVIHRCQGKRESAFVGRERCTIAVCFIVFFAKSNSRVISSL